MRRFNGQHRRSPDGTRGSGQHVAAVFQIFANSFGHLRVHLEAAQARLILAERAGVMRGGKPGRGHGLLRSHPEINVFEEKLQGRLILQIAPGDRDSQNRTAAFENKRGSESDARPLAGCDAIRMACPGVEAGQARAVDDAGVAGGTRRTAQPAGSGGDYVAPAIRHAHDGGTARGTGRRPWLLEGPHTIGIAGANLLGRPLHVDRGRSSRAPARPPG